MAPNLLERLKGCKTEQVSVNTYLSIVSISLPDFQKQKQAPIDPINVVEDEPPIVGLHPAITDNPSRTVDAPSHAATSTQGGKCRRIAAAASKVVNKTHLRDIATLFRHHEPHSGASTIPSVPSLPNDNDDNSSYVELLPLSESELGSSLSSSLSSTKAFDFINQNNLIPVPHARVTRLPLPQIYRPKTRRDIFFGGCGLDYEREVLRNTSAFTFGTIPSSNETAQISVSTSSDRSTSKSAGEDFSKSPLSDNATSEGSDQDLRKSTGSSHEGDDTVIRTDPAVAIRDDELDVETDEDEALYEWPARPIPPRNPPRLLHASSQPWFLSSSPSASVVDDAEAGIIKSQHEISHEVVNVAPDSMDSLGITSSAAAESVLDAQDTIRATHHLNNQQTSEDVAHGESRFASQLASSNPSDRLTLELPASDAPTSHQPTSGPSKSTHDSSDQSDSDHAISNDIPIGLSTAIRPISSRTTSNRPVPDRLTSNDSASDRLLSDRAISSHSASNGTTPVHDSVSKRSDNLRHAAPALQALGKLTDAKLQIAASAEQSIASAPSKRSRFKSFFQKDYRCPTEATIQHGVVETSPRKSVQDPEPLSKSASILTQSRKHVRSKLSRAGSVFQSPRDAVALSAQILQNLPPPDQFPLSLTAAPVSQHGSVLGQAKQQVVSKRSRFASFLQQQEQQPQGIANTTQQQVKHIDPDVTSGGYPSMFNKNGMFSDVIPQAILDRLSKIQPPQQNKQKIPTGAESDYNRARFANATARSPSNFVSSANPSRESSIGDASKVERGDADGSLHDRRVSNSLIPEGLSPQAKQYGGLLTSNKLRELSKKPGYAHPVGTRNHHVRPSNDDAAAVNKRPGTPFAHGRVVRKLHCPALPAAFDSDESMVVHAPNSPQVLDLPQDGLPDHILNVPAGAAIVNDPLFGTPATGHHASSQYANDGRALERYQTYVGKGKAPVGPQSTRQYTSGRYGYGSGLTQHGAAMYISPVEDYFEQQRQRLHGILDAAGIDSPDRALRAAMDPADIYTYSSANSVGELAGVHFPKEPRPYTPTNGHTRFSLADEHGKTVHQYYGTCPNLIALDGRYLHVDCTPPSTPQEQIVPARLWLLTDAGLLLHPAVRPAEESWETVEGSDPTTIDWTVAPRLKFDVNKASPLGTPVVRDSDDSSDGSLAFQEFDSVLQNSPSVPAQQHLERRALEQVEIEREDRLGLLFLHRKTYGQRCRVLWPDQPMKQVAIDAENMSRNDNHAQAREDALSEANEVLYKKIHRALVLANLEGDFHIFDRSPEQTAEYLKKYRLVPTPEIKNFLAGIMEQHQPVDFLAEQHVQDTLLFWKVGRTPKYCELHRLGIPFANVFVSRRGSAYALEQLRVPRRILGKEDPQIDELEARGMEIETVPEHELQRWDEMYAQMCANQDAWKKANPMPMHMPQDEHQSGHSTQEDVSGVWPGVQAEFEI